jgi:hypothetical protein
MVTFSKDSGFEQDKIGFAFPAFLDRRDAVVGDGVVSASLEPGFRDEAAPNHVLPDEDDRDAMRAEEPALHGFVLRAFLQV